jgi:hypothetical protein
MTVVLFLTGIGTAVFDEGQKANDERRTTKEERWRFRPSSLVFRWSFVQK